MVPYQRPQRRTRRPNNDVLLDRAWAQRLGVQRTGGLYRMGRRELAARLARLNAPKPPLDDLVAMEGHAHAVGFYETDAFLVGCVRDFLSPSLLAGGAAIVVASASHRDAFGHALEKAGIDLPEAQRHGRYLALDASEALSTLMADGMPDAARFRTAMGDLISRAAQGPREVRIYGEMVAVLCGQGNIAAAIALEQLWNELAAAHPFSLFCAYPIRAFATSTGTEQMQEVCAKHSKVLATVG
jgi:hypothetical protein